MHAVQILKQPNTTCAVHGRQKKNYVCLFAIREADEFCYHGVIIEIVESPVCELTFRLHAGVLVKVVVGAHAILVEEKEYLFATLTTKIPVMV
jgi:hypothetical protein